jgi:hypothetical protein
MVEHRVSEPTGTLFLSERAEKICVSNEHKDIGGTRTECPEQLPGAFAY